MPHWSALIPPSLWTDWISHVVPNGDMAQLRATIEAARPRMSRLRDPFLPLVQGEARSGETVLWEDATTLVLVDRFGTPPKALVVPKREALFPPDLGEEGIAALAVIARCVMDAFIATVGGSARAWINPPAALSVRQLHVHVLGAALGPIPADFDRRVEAALCRTLGAKTTIPSSLTITGTEQT